MDQISPNEQEANDATGSIETTDYAELQRKADAELAAEKVASLPNKIKTLELPPAEPGREYIEPGGALIVLQVNAQDMRKELGEGQEFGQLEPSAAEAAKSHAEEMVQQLLASMPEDERDSLDVLVFASDGTLVTPTGNTSEHRRGIETAEKVIEGIQAAGVTRINDADIINRLGVEPGEPFGVDALKDLRVLEGMGIPEADRTEQERKNVEYINYLKEKYSGPTDTGHGEQFWVNFEIDAGEDQAKRLSLGAEGPDEVAERMNDTMATITRLASGYSQTNPDRRLLVWVESHYDTISPYVKNNVVDLGDQRDRYLAFAKGSGIVMEVAAEQFKISADAAAAHEDIPPIVARATVAGKEYFFDAAPGKDWPEPEEAEKGSAEPE